MVTKRYTFNTIDNLLNIDRSLDSPTTLIQIFSNFTGKTFLKQLQEFFSQNFPLSTLIGSTADGVIDGESFYDDKHIVTITKFEETTLQAVFLEHENIQDSCFYTGKKVANSLIKENTKVIIAFSDGINTNGEDFVKGIASVNDDVLLAGGMAGDNGNIVETFVFDKEHITSNGVVAVALHSDTLNVANSYNFDWTPIGKELVINKVVKNRVYEIDGMRAVEVYAKYLGSDIAKNLPRTGIEFPLIFQKDGTTVGRAVLVRHSDDSLTFAGNFKEGEKVRFGVGNADMIIRDASYKLNKNLKELPFKPEAIFSYSCMARKRFLQDFVQVELSILNQLGYISGFYTYGEFFHTNKSNELLNETMTLLMLSESKAPLEFVEKPKESSSIELQAVGTVHALAHLANVVSSELEELNRSLEAKIKENTDYIYKQAYFDKLTGLPNRLSLIKRLQDSIGEVVILINIDDFTSINDFYGHLVGDKVIKRLGEILSTYVQTKENMELYKLPSDEFAILMKIEYEFEKVEQQLKEIIHTVEDSIFRIDDISIYISVSASAALTNSSGNGLANADMALKYAKKTSQPYIIYKNDIDALEKYKTNLSMATQLKEAIDENKIVPFYQPIFDFRTKQIIKYEALVRLEKKDGSYLSPYFFLELSQRIKLYPKITQIMIDKTFSYAKEKGINFSLNLAFEDILNERTYKYLFDQIKRYDIASQLTIEILETQEITQENEILRFLKELHAIGVQIAIDDFGSGFANFEYLAKIDADVIKIDGSLIKNIDKDPHARIVAETIIAFANKLGKKTIAEFVHSKEILDIVSELGVDYAQGFYLAEPALEI